MEQEEIQGGFAAVAIMGLGLIGASTASALKNAYPNMFIVGVDTDGKTCVTAKKKGWVDEAFLPGDEGFEVFVRDRADLAIIATPVPVVPEYLGMLAKWDFKGVITDTASTKASISKAAGEILPYPDNYVPGHPMAGSEINGIQGAKPDLFKGAHWILCPDANTPAEHFQRLHTMICGLGARVLSLAREDHDEAIAVVSHVPHFVASSLVTLASRHADDQKTLMRLAAGGFKDSTRIAAGSAKLWCGIAFDNKDALCSGLEEMEGILESFRRAIAEGDKEALAALLEQASAARRALPAAWVPSTEDLLEVRIPMEDRRGVVAEVTTIASSVGCNIQSIEIDHVTEDSAVLSMIFTDEGDVGKLSMQLIKAGYSVSFHPLSAKEHHNG